MAVEITTTLLSYCGGATGVNDTFFRVNWLLQMRNKFAVVLY